MSIEDIPYKNERGSPKPLKGSDRYKKVYQKILKECIRCVHAHEIMNMEIKGTFERGRYKDQHPRVELWEEFNPEEIKAITVISNELYERGWWLEKINITEVWAGMSSYHGGERLIIKCDFS